MDLAVYVMRSAIIAVIQELLLKAIPMTMSAMPIATNASPIDRLRAISTIMPVTNTAISAMLIEQRNILIPITATINAMSVAIREQPSIRTATCAMQSAMSVAITVLRLIIIPMRVIRPAILVV